MKQLFILALCVFSYTSSFSQVNRNFDLELVEKDSLKSGVIERAVEGFLTEARLNNYTEKYVDLDHLKKYEFFFRKLAGIGNNTEQVTFNPPNILKSFSKDGETYWITVAFTGSRNDTPFVFQVTELKAVPHGDSYRFYCPFEDRTKSLKQKTINTVTFHYSDDFDEEKAQEFSDVKDELSRLTNTAPQKLDYYSFESLDELLKSYGFLYSARQCNFLYCDLGFSDNDGKFFVTGTDNENYLSEYVEDFIYYNLPNKEDVYWTFLTGTSMYYGGYGLSLIPVDELKKELRDEYARNPSFNFLEEFKKGRKSSVNRHFCHYSISAILCQEVMKKKGFDDVLSLVYSGENGENFFENLEKTVGINEENFNEHIVRLIQE